MTMARKPSASSRRATLTVESGDAIERDGMVRFKIDPLNPPPLSERSKAELARLATMRDEDIDYSDAPPLDDSFWKNAVRNPFFRPIKQQLTIRLDADVLDWLKSGGKGWQTKLNYHLRQAMERERGVKR